MQFIAVLLQDSQYRKTVTHVAQCLTNFTNCRLLKIYMVDK